jgi:hydrogenase-4 membrane subunit HyfE
VALVLETQFFRGGRRHNLAGLLVPPIVVASFIVGEAIALHALYVGFAHRQDQVLVVGALVLGTLALLWPVFAPRAVALFRQDRSADYRLFVIAVWAALAAFVGYSLYVILFRY